MPRVHSVFPRFQFGVPVDFVIHGKGFVKGALLDVDLFSEDNYRWTVNSVTFVDAKRIRVNATPADAPGLRGAGIGDLTTTVTNGDGKVSNSQSQDVSYEL
jgi:hypothetical protein